MVLWRGRLTFRQHIPGKQHKYGVKIYMLFVTTGYVWNALVYSGESDPISGLGHAASFVMKLIEKWLDCGHVLFVDNFYTSFPLSHELWKERRCSVALYGEIASTCWKQSYQQSRKVDSMSHAGMDVQSSWSGRTKKTWWCSQLFTLGRWCTAAKRTGVVNWSRSWTASSTIISTCGVDRMDQLMAYYTPLRKTIKWYRKVVLQFLDIAVMNAYLRIR